MKKVHIALIGWEVQPVYRVIKAIKPEIVVLIYSHETKEKVKHIKECIKTHIEWEEYELEATNSQVIKTQAEILAEKYKDDEVTVNISGGTKSWSYFFGLTFSSRDNFTVLYIDQNNILYNYKTLTSERIKIDDPLEDLHIDSYIDFDIYTPADDDVAMRVEKLRCEYKFIPDFNTLTTVLNKKQQASLKFSKADKFTLPNSASYIEWRKADEENCNEYVFIYLCNELGEERSETFESPNALSICFNAGWFEYKVAKMLKKWKQVQKVLLNCKFKFIDNKDKNEIDIIATTEDKALFVECKTQVSTPTFVDKFNSVIKHYGGKGCKGLFITYEKMDKNVITKCVEYGLLFYSVKMSKEGGLASLLESKINNLNA